VSSTPSHQCDDFQPIGLAQAVFGVRGARHEL
jgi:hypothetical protein